ncbi:DUF1707 SHOCT-like domain-containing protein [Actinomadura kijaniata]|uniref:DUF1707 SHOCT-like domain-containing protein n=1 Tax=Actinomadura kijaniata TaxID=46161 RepID=UPI00082F1920|nr:DUF1707 domain-containing protein [Actinomadura kijaniata]
MAPNPDIRASDADRDRVASALREHCAQGRITIDELNERLESVYAARTLGELEAVTADLPEEDLYQLPVPAAQKTTGGLPAPRSGAGALERFGGRGAWATWAAVSGINLAIWAILLVAVGPVYPWWIWVAGPWGAALLIGSLLGSGRRD